MIAYCLSDAICQTGVVSLTIARAAKDRGLVTEAIGEGQPHFSWRKEALDRLPVSTLEKILINLREAAAVA